MNKKNKKILIIGAGISGLATGALLGKKGYDVTILEKNNSVGGRAMTWKKDGFTFDMGPSWYLMPDVFDRYFAHFGNKTSDMYTLTRLDPSYRVFFKEDPENYIDMKKDLNKNLETFDKIAPGSGKVIKEYLEISKYQYEIAMEKFVYKNYDSLIDILDPQLIIKGTKLNIFKSLNNFISGYTQSEKLKKILQYTMVFLGGSPEKTPALYSIMSHIDFNLGVYYPQGGIFSLIKAILSLCKENNVKIETDQEVIGIISKYKNVKEIETNKGKYTADIFISNADYPHTEINLLDRRDQTYPKNYWERKTIAPSCFIMYLGLKSKIEKLQHHNLFFAKNWTEHFKQIFDKPSWPSDPSYYICCPSKTDCSVAPKNCENVFVLVPVAPGLEDDNKKREIYSKKIISDIERQIGEKISDKIIVKRIFSHRDYKSEFNAYKGTALGFAHTLFQTAVFRPKNKSPKLKNLYYTGQYTHPGIGLPMGLISAELVVENVGKI